MSNYIISENGNFPPQYNVLKKGEDGIYRVIFGPDPDLEDAERKHKELSSTPKKSVKKETVKKEPVKKKTVTKKKTVKKKTPKKK
tara:strand:+ start:108 stop:362 length:255 start_codon:yes stop_codon:yes gene_type:complete